MKAIHTDRNYIAKHSGDIELRVEHVCHKYGTVRFTNGWVIALSLFHSYYEELQPNRIENRDRMSWLETVYYFEFDAGDDSEGLLASEIPVDVATQLVAYDLICFNSHAGRNGYPSEPYYTLTAWGERIVEMRREELGL